MRSEKNEENEVFYLIFYEISHNLRVKIITEMIDSIHDYTADPFDEVIIRNGLISLLIHSEHHNKIPSEGVKYYKVARDSMMFLFIKLSLMSKGQQSLFQRDINFFKNVLLVSDSDYREEVKNHKKETPKFNSIEELNDWLFSEKRVRELV